MSTLQFVEDVEASPAIVWSVLADYPGMTNWAGARTVDIERPGVDVPNGVGTIRALKSWHGTIREEITGFEPERRMSYKGLSGVPALDYRGVVELSRRGDTTQMSWTVSFQPRKYTAAIVSFVIKRMVSTGIDRFVEVVEGKANIGSQVPARAGTTPPTGTEQPPQIEGCTRIRPTKASQIPDPRGQSHIKFEEITADTLVGPHSVRTYWSSRHPGALIPTSVRSISLCRGTAALRPVARAG